MKIGADDVDGISTDGIDAPFQQFPRPIRAVHGINQNLQACGFQFGDPLCGQHLMIKMN